VLSGAASAAPARETEETPEAEDVESRPVASEDVEMDATEDEADMLSEDQIELADRESAVETLEDDDEEKDAGEEDAEDESSLLPFMNEETAEAEEPEPETAAIDFDQPAPQPASEPAPEPTPEPKADSGAEETGKPGILATMLRKKVPGTKDPLVGEAAELVIKQGRASVVLLQRRLDIGYTRASRLIDTLEKEGLVGPLTESGSRDVLLTLEEWQERAV
jgi:hypothetical protein